MAYNGLFYTGEPLPATAYRSWLLSNGVSYVALADAPLDYAATAEAVLLRSGQVDGLQAVWRNAHWQLWQVVGSPGLASGPARIPVPHPPLGEDPGVGARPERAQVAVVALLVHRPYFRGAGVPGAGLRGAGGLRRGPGGWTDLSADAAGELGLSLSVAHANHGHCPPAGSVRS